MSVLTGALMGQLGAVAYQLGNTSSRTITEVKQCFPYLSRTLTAVSKVFVMCIAAEGTIKMLSLVSTWMGDCCSVA